jgi:hypothetical protein
VVLLNVASSGADYRTWTSSGARIQHNQTPSHPLDQVSSSNPTVLSYLYIPGLPLPHSEQLLRNALTFTYI